MAQDNAPNIPEQISWIAEPKSDKKYKASRAVETQTQPKGLDVFSAPTGFTKNTQSHSAQDLGDAIQINFDKPAFPDGNGSGGKQKGSAYTAQIIDVQVIEDLNQKALNDFAPEYDGFQPNYAHCSDSLDPHKMKECVQSILESLEQLEMIDYYAITPFNYCGRSFGSRDDCEFRLSIFSDSNFKSVVELRRSAGECFIYSNVEGKILGNLLKKNAIVKQEMENDDDDVNDNDEKDDSNNNDNNDDNDDDDDDDDFGSFGFGFDSLPSLDSLDLDSSFSDNNDDDGKQKVLSTKIDAEMAESIVNDAVDQSSMRDVWRSDIAFLNDAIAKHEDVFRNIPNIIETVVAAISNNVFDCWAIKTYLEVISKLISCQASAPKNLDSTIEAIQIRWSHMVVNKVAPGVEFKFAPSQQIVRRCTQLREQLKK